MAIDTAGKRASLIGYGLPLRLMLPFADGEIDQGDRQHLAGLYAGVLAGEAEVAIPEAGFILGDVQARTGFILGDVQARTGFILGD